MKPSRRFTIDVEWPMHKYVILSEYNLDKNRTDKRVLKQIGSEQSIPVYETYMVYPTFIQAVDLIHKLEAK